MKIILQSLVIILFITLRVYSIVPDDSIQWISKFYGIGWPVGDPCTVIAPISNSSYQLQCNGGKITAIYINGPTPVDHGPPDGSLTLFDIPDLMTFSAPGQNPIYPSNILDKMVSLTSLRDINLAYGSYITSIPDEIFQNNANLTTLTCINCINLTYLNYAKAYRLTRIALDSTPVTNIDFGTAIFTNLYEIILSKIGDGTITFSNNQFPKLDKIQVNTNLLSSKSANVYLNISVDSLSELTINTVFNSLSLNLNCPNVTKLTLQFKNNITDYTNFSLVRPLNLGTPNLNFLKTTYLYSAFPKIDNLNYLASVEIQSSKFTSFPSFPNSIEILVVKDMTSLTSFPDPFLNNTKPYSSLIFAGLPNLTGRVPTTFCNARSIYLLDMAITELPDCMRCNFQQIKTRLPPNFTPPSMANCSISVSPTVVGSDGNKITITGSLLGWGNNASDQSTGLSVLVPNSAFAYTLTNGTTDGSAIVYFSYFNNYRVNISWIYSAVLVTGASAQQNPSGLVMVSILGSFITSLVHYVEFNGQVYTAYSFQPTLMSLLFPQDRVAIGPNSFRVFNDYITATPSLMNYFPTFPLITSVSAVSPSTKIFPGTSIAVKGSFGGFTSMGANVTINDNIPCKIESNDSATIQCKLPNNTQIGTTRLRVNVVGFNSSTFYFMILSDPSSPPTCQQNNYCSSHGTCNQFGECDCDTGYSGESCQYQNNDDTVFHPYNTSTVASFQANGYQFNFTLVSIQELDIKDSIIRELLTNSWTSAVTDSTLNTTINYSLFTSQPSLTVNTSIIFTKQSGSYTFGNVVRSIPSNSLKISVLIKGWLYSSPLNRLRVVFKTNLEESFDECGNQVNTLIYDGNSKGLKYLKVIRNGIVFFGSFQDIVVVDNYPVYTINQVLNQTDSQTIHIGVLMPNCQKCLIDPDFSALVDTNNYGNSGSTCGTPTKGLSKEQIIGIAIGSSAAALVAVMITVFIIKKKYSIVKSGKLLKLVTVK